jgi:hypothetical protein
MLANVESLPSASAGFSADEMVHKQTQRLLQSNQVEQAWSLLIK